MTEAEYTEKMRELLAQLGDLDSQYQAARKSITNQMDELDSAWHNQVHNSLWQEAIRRKQERDANPPTAVLTEQPIYRAPTWNEFMDSQAERARAARIAPIR